ncbi:MAG TPA: hypothetical protein VGW38_02525 [Chloroflexota bacterium]|nr:hypothetical protein [Chloroflexota bacterium]
MPGNNRPADPFEDLLHALVRAEQEARAWRGRCHTGPVATLDRLLQEQPNHEPLAPISAQLHAITEQQDVLVKQLQALQWQVLAYGNASLERQGGGFAGGLAGGLSSGTYQAFCGGRY